MNRIQRKLLQFLRKHQVLTVAVTETDGHPYAAALFYAVDDDLSFYVVSDSTTRHGTAMLAVGVVAGTIQRDRQEWNELRGAQFIGKCARLEGVEYAKGWAVFLKRFVFLQAVKRDGVGALASALAKMDLWRIEPSWIRLLDNRVGFAHKEEWRRST